MASEKRLIDANAFLSAMIKRFHCVPLIGRNDYDCETLKQMLIEAPTVEAVEVVRCKDCRNYDDGGYCWFWKYETGMSPNEVEPDDFCSYGERKDNE